MKQKTAFLFPGQGAQYVGMGQEFYQNSSEAKQIFEEADELLSDSFSKKMFSGDSNELKLTKNSQLAIFICSIAILRAVEKQFPSLRPSFCAGLSLGEYSALVASQKVSFQEALFLVRDRGRFMQEACLQQAGGMRVILGLDEESTITHLNNFSAQTESFKPRIWAANFNCPGQVVIAGHLDALDPAVEFLKGKGAKRALPLDVVGAFHTPLMASAAEQLKEMIIKTSFSSSEIALVMNAVGTVVFDQQAIQRYLIEQVTSPVYWEKGIKALEKEEVVLYVEMGPGKTLKGMNQKIGVRAPTLNVEYWRDLEEVYDFLKG
jgi:[acyl-carrier-protein] S-malonyltransferase